MELFDKDKAAELEQRRAEAWKAADDFYWAHVDDKLTMSEADAKAYKHMLVDVKKIDDQIYAEKQKPTTAPIRDAIGYEYGDGSANTGGFKMAGITGTKDYKKNFFNAMRARFVDSVKNSYLQTGEPSQGGYLCPDEMDSAIVAKLQDENIMRKIGKVITTANTHKIPIVASQPTASWIREGAPIQFSDETFSQLSLDAYKLAVGVKVSNELLADSFYRLDEFLISEFSKSIAAAEEEAFIGGQGAAAGTPKGFLTSLAEDAASTTITTRNTSISADDVINLVYKLSRPYRRNACFLMADSTLGLIRKIKDADQRFIWEASLQNSEPPSISGYPVHTSTAMPTDTIAFGDFSTYVIGDRGGRTMKSLHELFAVEDLAAFIMLQRVDGILTDSNAIRLLKLKS